MLTGIIDVIGTDHAPHPAETKECEWACAANGMTGLEQALSIIQMTLVDTGMITWRDVARILSEEPAKIGRLDHEQGRPLPKATGKHCAGRPEGNPRDQAGGAGNQG